MTDSLADSKSPFLRHGAEQPVAWMPWGEAAFERARDEDRPILMDIGAVWCHWCHVMDRESYDDPETAAVINELYVPVKVDRDERPDVDARYQRAVQSLVGQGGWPLTAFLTPDGEVFHGGTYFPPEEAHGRPSFRAVLREVARVWTEERDRADRLADAISERVRTVLTGEAIPGELRPALIDDAVAALGRAYDERHGGFGQAPKFPNAGGLALLLDEWLDTGSGDARDMLATTLRAMVAGGLHDQLGGGFHRYSTDARWIIPHFEKMAYDNGVLLAVLARAGGALGDDGAGALRDAAAGVVAYYRDVAPELVEAGGFPASQDADIGPDDDGDYWTWTEAEVRAAVEDGGGGDEADEEMAEAAVLRWGVRDDHGAMHRDPDRHVLFRAMSVEEVARALGSGSGEVGAGEPAASDVATMLETARAHLKATRDQRPRPYVDTTLFTGWVALVASGHLVAARHAGVEGAGPAAVRALDRVWREGWTEERGVAHRLGDEDGVAQLADQAYVAAAAVDAFEWTQEPAWLERAGKLVAVIRDRFAHPSGGLRDRPADAAAEVDVLGAGRLEITDSPEPSPTAVAAMTMARLGALEHDDALTAAARDILTAYAGSAPQFAANAATYFRALRWAVRPVTTVVVVEEAGARAGAGAAADSAPGSGPGTGPAALLRAALGAYRPGTVVRRYAPGELRAAAGADTPPATMPDAVAAMLTGDAPRAYVCEGTRCKAPVSEPSALTELLVGGR